MVELYLRTGRAISSPTQPSATRSADRGQARQLVRQRSAPSCEPWHLRMFSWILYSSPRGVTAEATKSNARRILAPPSLPSRRTPAPHASGPSASCVVLPMGTARRARGAPTAEPSCGAPRENFGLGRSGGRREVTLPCSTRGSDHVVGISVVASSTSRA